MPSHAIKQVSRSVDTTAKTGNTPVAVVVQAGVQRLQRGRRLRRVRGRGGGLLGAAAAQDGNAPAAQARQLGLQHLLARAAPDAQPSSSKKKPYFKVFMLLVREHGANTSVAHTCHASEPLRAQRQDVVRLRARNKRAAPALAAGLLLQGLLLLLLLLVAALAQLLRIPAAQPRSQIRQQEMTPAHLTETQARRRRSRGLGR